MRHSLAAYLLCGRQILSAFRKSPCFTVSIAAVSTSILKSKILTIVLLIRYCVMKLTERLKKEGIDINLRDALGVDTDPKLRNLRGKL